MVTDQIECALLDFCKDRCWDYIALVATLHELYVWMLLCVVRDGIFSEFVEGVLCYMLRCSIQTDVALVGFKLYTV